MTVSPLAGKLVAPDRLADIPKLVDAYASIRPDPTSAAQRVSFGTSGHRGSSLHGTFNEAHVLAITQAICAYRAQQGITGPLFLGRDTHALSQPAFDSALEVLAANNVETMVDSLGRHTATPAVSHAILTHNAGRDRGLADGILITPSHNPPEDGGFKYNPTTGGPADTDITSGIERTANQLLQDGLRDVRRLAPAAVRSSGRVHTFDYVQNYVADLANVVDLEAVRSSGLRIGIDPLGGASVDFWQAIADHYGLNATIINDAVDPTFRFVPADWDGKIRMDCSSPHAMAQLLAQRDRFDIAFANDPDADRHGIVTRSGGLLKPNDYLAAAIAYLAQNRPDWRPDWAIGKTVVSSGMIDRVAAHFGRTVKEVPVGFKWFVSGLLDGSFGFAGEESAGASFLRRDGTVWTTEKDGLILGLLAAEITARTGRDPGELYRGLTAELGTPFYERTDAPADAQQRKALSNASADAVRLDQLAGEPVRQVLAEAPGNGRRFGGIKVVADNGWFATRASGTEDVYKIYAESFQSEAHLRQIQHDAQEAVGRLFTAA